MKTLLAPSQKQILYMTQFQIEGGGLVQGVNKLTITFSVLQPTTKSMKIMLRKNVVDSSL